MISHVQRVNERIATQGHGPLSDCSALRRLLQPDMVGGGEIHARCRHQLFPSIAVLAQSLKGDAPIRMDGASARRALGLLVQRHGADGVATIEVLVCAKLE